MKTQDPQNQGYRSFHNPKPLTPTPENPYAKNIKDTGSPLNESSKNLMMSWQHLREMDCNLAAQSNNDLLTSS